MGEKKKTSGVVYAAVTLLFLGWCVYRPDKGSDTAATPAKATAAPKGCSTPLNCKIEAVTARMTEHCPQAGSLARFAEDQSYDLKRGVMTGALSASEVRSASAQLAATREYAAEHKAHCQAARTELGKLADESARVIRAEEKAAAKAAAGAKKKAVVSAKATSPSKPGQAVAAAPPTK